MSTPTRPSSDTSKFERPPPVVLPWAIVGLLIAIVIYLSVTPKPQPMRRLWVPLVVDTNDSTTVLGETRQLEFWTPSAKTKDYLHKEKDQVVDKEKWQVLSSDDAVIAFGNMLHTNQNVFGYRRSEIWGQGRTTFKPGWWWVMNVSTDYTAVDLSHAYQQYWKSAQPVLVEVIDNRGSER